MKTGIRLFLTRTVTVCVLALLLAQFLQAQPLQLQINDVNTSTFPRIALKTLLTENGAIRNQSGGVVYSVHENGVPVNFDIICPEAYNSIALVVHPGCFWFHPRNTSATDSLPIALQAFLDRLGPDDEVQITLTDTTDTGAFIQRGFTSDKALLRQFAGSIEPVDRVDVNAKTNINTHLLETVDAAVQSLLTRSGKKTVIIYTSDISTERFWLEEFSHGTNQTLARGFLSTCLKNNIPIHTISWMVYGNGPDFDRKFIRLSRETGGDLYHFHKATGDTLRRTSIDLASRLQEPYCTISYQAPNCTDSVRHIKVTAEASRQVAIRDTLFRSPWRPDTVHFVTDAHITDAIPPELFEVSFRVEPRLDKDMLLSFSFLIRYDSEAFAWTAPIAKGHMMEDYQLTPAQLHPGTLRLTGAYMVPSNDTGDFVIARFRALTTAGSRPAIITLDSVDITAGCPNTVITHSDTVFVCRCAYGLPFTLDGTPVISTDDVRFPVMVPDTLLFGQKPISGDAHYTLSMYFDSSSLSPTSVEGVATVSENATINWKVVNGDTLRVWTSEPFPSMPGNVLFNAHFAVNHGKSPVYSSIGVPAMRLFTDCCFTQSDSLPNSILIDGLCDKVVRRRADFTLQPNAPNPARGETSFQFTVHENERFSEAPATLTIYRSDGTVVDEVYHATVRAGEHLVPYNTSGLPAGTYYYTLTISGRMQTRSLVVVK